MPGSKQMTNYLVRSLYQITQGMMRLKSEHYTAYKAMHELTLPLLEKYVQGNWQLILLQGSANTVHDMFKEVFVRTYQLWKSEPCNVLFVDLDIMTFHGVDIFDQYQHFTMFDTEGQKQRKFETKTTVLYRNETFWNCGLRYFPSTMSEATWGVGFSLFDSWTDNNEYDREQLIYSRMLNSQTEFVPSSQRLIIQRTAAEFENVEVAKNTPMIHFHSSRGPWENLEYMKNYSPLVQNHYTKQW